MNKKFLLSILSFSLFASINFSGIAEEAEEPVRLGTEKEDISLTDNIAIAKAQVAKYPDNPEAHFNLAIALTRTSLVEEAIKELRMTKILIRKPENAGTIDKKIKEYEQILKNDPDAHNIRYRLGFSHYLKAYFFAKEEEKKQKETTENKKNSLNLLEANSLYIKSKNPEILNNLKKSTSYFEELIKKDPSDIWAKVYYGFILAEQFNDVAKARSVWNDALQQDPKNPAPHFFLGELHIKEGNLKDGIAKIGEALLLRAQGY